MNPDRWRRVEELFHAAQARAPQDRLAFLDEACGDDVALRRDVDELLAQPASADVFFARPAIAAAPQISNAAESVVIGQRIGNYRIDEAIGAGGMGEVYRARDLKLGRQVAIKILPTAFISDSARLQRFEREARLLAALNHPNIATIHGVENDGDTPAIVMELVEGQTLADRLAVRPLGLPIADVLGIARQIADALDAAHEKGIIHRDLKPGNVKITPADLVKVLDFGLAKLQPPDGQSGFTEAPTALSAATHAGIIMGTAAYMSPEQARGQSPDKRTDIWAFGCVLFEMLTGRAAFARATVSETIAAVLEREPDWQTLPASTPPALRKLLERCLVKPLGLRLRDIGDARYELDHSADAADPVSRRSTARQLAVVASALALAAVSIVVAWLVLSGRGNRTSPPEVTRLSIPLAADDSFNIVGQPPIAVSPDGRRVVFAINQRLYHRRLDQLDAQPIAGTEPPPSLPPGRGPGWAHNPFFSPDGQWVGFSEAGAMKKVPVAGGGTITVSEHADAMGPPTWLSDGTILYGSADAEERVGGIWRVPASGGTPERIISVNTGERALAPQLLPGGTELLFTLSPGSRTDIADVVVQSLATGERHVILHGGHSARYVTTGHLIYGHDRTLFAVRYDLTRHRTIGTPVPVLSNVAEEVSAGAWGGVEYNLSDDGTLVYLPDSAVRLRRVLEWVDREGHSQPLDMEGRAYEYPRISPDGQRVLLDLRDEQNDAWIWEFDRRTLTRVTFDRHSGGPVVWAPDGSRAIFAPERDGVLNLFWKPISGGTEERLLTSSSTQYANVVTPNGEYVVFEEVDPKTKFNLRLLRLDTRASSPLIETPFNDQNPALSSDGAWLAYQSDESGRAEVYVRPFPNVNAARWQVSTSGGTRPLFSRDGRELFYLDIDRRLTVVPVQMQPPFRVGSPRTLFDTKPFGLEGINRNFDISPDGSRFLMVRNLPIPPDAKRFIVVQHWLEELKRLVPPQ